MLTINAGSGMYSAFDILWHDSGMTAPWNDGAWTSRVLGGDQGSNNGLSVDDLRLAVRNTTDYTNPPAGDGRTNELNAKNIVKAWGAFQTVGGGGTGYTITDGFNFDSCVVGASNVQCLFTDPMADGNYAVVSMLETSSDYFPTVTNLNTTYFRLMVWDASAGGFFDPRGAVYKWKFIVLAKQTS
jgi:hypothetical protein